ncbi:hypothetical protein CW304_20735 [Bacillus sp. UFRGS-B20]|nr:hypothetical protein CW304_20735 [Bacillus sp. UFRGS-B20]
MPRECCIPPHPAPPPLCRFDIGQSNNPALAKKIRYFLLLPLAYIHTWDNNIAASKHVGTMIIFCDSAFARCCVSFEKVPKD